MMIANSPARRSGAVTVETAIIFPIFFFLVMGLVIGGHGVFIFQEVAYLAREGARWAAVHGADYERESHNPAATPEDVYNKVIKPRLVALNPQLLTYSVTWDKNNQPYSTSTNYETPRGNSVTVTVSYQWFPELYLVGPYNLTSSSTLPMAY